MKFTPFKLSLLSMILLLCAGNIIAAGRAITRQPNMPAKEEVASEQSKSKCDDDCDEDCPPVKIANLCVGKFAAKKITARDIVAKKACAQEFKSERIAAERGTVRHLCAEGIRASQACVNNMNTNNICANGLTKVNAFQQCGTYRATIVFDTVTTYTLGSTLDFNTIIDDPNHNLHVSPYTYYEAPLTGYYIVTLQVDQQNLVGNLPVLGVPVTNIQILVNGVIERQNYNPYLTFHNEQFANLSALIRLNAGDKLTGVYNLFVMQDGVGFVPYVGTVDVSGNGTDQNVSLLSVHYLSSTCTTPPCAESVCDFPCESHIDTHCPKVDCDPCHSR